MNVRWILVTVWGLMILVAPSVFELSMVSAREKTMVTRRYALLVGANDGGSTRVKLRYAVKDARALSGVLAQLGGIPSSEQVFVENPDVVGLVTSLKDLGARIRKDRADSLSRIEVLVYYSGHSDEKGLLLKGDRMTYKSLRGHLNALHADVRVIVLDSCSSGAMTRTKGGRRIPAFLKDQAVYVRGQAILTSSSEYEAAQESDRLRGSFFTHYLISGLRGAADVTGDRRVTLNEAYQFAFKETLERTEHTRGGAQHPAYDIQLTGHGDLVLTELSQTNASLMLSKQLSGRVFIRDAESNLVVELQKLPGRVVEIGLKANAYSVQLVQGKKLWGTTLSVPYGKRVQLSQEQFKPKFFEVTTLRGSSTHAQRSSYAHDQQSQKLYFGVDLFPFMGSSSFYPFAPRYVSLNLVSGIAGGLRGFELGAVANIHSGDVRGLQIGGVTNVVHGHASALQIAGVFNYATQGVYGVQFAPVNASIGGVKGAQLGGINTAFGGMRGSQIGGVNLSTGLLTGGQVGGVNVEVGTLHGFQVGAIDLAGSVVGTQFGGINLGTLDVVGLQIGGINMGLDEVNGVQIGAINLSMGHVSGAQVGAINVAASSDASVGILNFFWNGRTQLDTWVTEALSTQSGVRHGSGAVYNIYTLGSKPFGPQRHVSFGLGLGWKKSLYPYMDLNIDAISHTIFDADNWGKDSSSLHKLRALLALKLTSWLEVYGGPTLNVQVSGGDTFKDYAPFGRLEFMEPDDDVQVSLWSGMVLGARIF